MKNPPTDAAPPTNADPDPIDSIRSLFEAENLAGTSGPWIGVYLELLAYDSLTASELNETKCLEEVPRSTLNNTLGKMQSEGTIELFYTEDGAKKPRYRLADPPSSPCRF